MKIIAIENGYEVNVREFSSYRELVQAMDSPRDMFCPDTFYLVQEELEENAVRERAEAEGKPLPLRRWGPSPPWMGSSLTEQVLRQQMSDLIHALNPGPLTGETARLKFGRFLCDPTEDA